MVIAYNAFEPEDLALAQAVLDEVWISLPSGVRSGPRAPECRDWLAKQVLASINNETFARETGSLLAGGPAPFLAAWLVALSGNKDCTPSRRAKARWIIRGCVMLWIHLNLKRHLFRSSNNLGSI